MKKIISIFLILSVFGIAAIKEKRSPVATLTFYLGQVVLKSNGIGDFFPVQKGMTLYEGDILKTQDDGKAEVFFYTGSKTRIANGTEIVFQNDENKQTKGIFLNVGQIWNQIRKGDKFEVESIHGVASVKGTEFDIANNGDQMNLWVAEGLVQLKNEQGELLAEKNTLSSLKKGGSPNKKLINPSELPNWQNNFSAEALLTLSAPGQKQEGKPFKINITLKDPKTDKLLTDVMVVSVKSLSRALDLALARDSNEFLQSIEVNIVDGKAEIWAKSQAGTHDLNFTGKKITGTTLPLKVEGAVNQRTVQLKFIGNDFKEHQIDIKYKLK